MVDQKQGAASKDEKAGKMVAADQKQATSTTGNSTGNDSATNAAPATPTKMELATEIYKQMRTVKDVTRKDIIERFVAEVKLTKAGAITYYKMIKDKREPQGKKQSAAWLGDTMKVPSAAFTFLGASSVWSSRLLGLISRRKQ